MLSSPVSLPSSASSRPAPYNQQFASIKRLQHVPAHRSVVGAPCQEIYGRQVPASCIQQCVVETVSTTPA